MSPDGAPGFGAISHFVGGPPAGDNGECLRMGDPPLGKRRDPAISPAEGSYPLPERQHARLRDSSVPKLEVPKPLSC